MQAGPFSPIADPTHPPDQRGGTEWPAAVRPGKSRISNRPAAPGAQHHHRIYLRCRPPLPLHDAHRLRPARPWRGDPAGNGRMSSKRRRPEACWSPRSRGNSRALPQVGSSRRKNLADTARVSVGLATFRRKKPFLDDRATDLGARTRRRPAAGRGTAASDTLIQPRIS
jgi:hypothetical protein